MHMINLDIKNARVEMPKLKKKEKFEKLEIIMIVKSYLVLIEKWQK